MVEVPEKLEQLKEEIKTPFFLIYLPSSIDADQLISIFEKEAKSFNGKPIPKNYFQILGE